MKTVEDTKVLWNVDISQLAQSKTENAQDSKSGELKTEISEVLIAVVWQNESLGSDSLSLPV